MRLPGEVQRPRDGDDLVRTIPRADRGVIEREEGQFSSVAAISDLVDGQDGCRQDQRASVRVLTIKVSMAN